MSDASRKKMIEAYIQEDATPRWFLAGFFQTPRRNFHTSETVEFDTQRADEDIAVPVPDITVRGRLNEATKYTNKEFKPPVYKEEVVVSAYDFLKRRPGRNPFDDVDWMAEAAREMRFGMRALENKIRRAVELQAAQVLQTGGLDLQDAASNSIYEIDYKPKTTHFPTAATSWATSTTKIADLAALCNVIHTDGKSRPQIAIFGSQALSRFLSDSAVLGLLDNRRLDIGSVGQPLVEGNGGTYHGQISVGQFSLAIWSYDGWYKDPGTESATYYIGADNVLVIAPGRRDLTYGDIPRIVAPDPRVAPIVLGRVSNMEGGMDLIHNAWVTPEGTSVHGAVYSRPLAIPTAIDTFGCLDTVP